MVIVGSAPGSANVALADVDGDGALDVVFTTFDGTISAVLWLRSTLLDAGSLGLAFEALPQEIVRTPCAVSSLDVGDLDGDGLPDIAVSTWLA